MNRRGFLSLVTAAITASFDPERALWVPGRKLISIPAPRPKVIQVFVNGVLQNPWAGDYRVTPDRRIAFDVPPQPGDVLAVNYLRNGRTNELNRHIDRMYIIGFGFVGMQLPADALL